MAETYRIVLAGSGGQGLGLGGRILAGGAVIQGLNATQGQSYGARARGGLSRSEVIISEGEIAYPLVEHPDILVALTQEAYDAFKPSLAPGGMVIYDSDVVKAAGLSGEHGFPVTGTARELHFEKGVTMLAMGLLTGLTRLVEEKNMEIALKNNFPKNMAQDNLRLFQKGLEMGNYPNRPVI